MVGWLGSRNKVTSARVYFHIDELSRDAIVASALKKYFAEKNISLVYGNRDITRNILPDCLNSFDAVILPKAHFIKNADIFRREATKIYCLFTESIGWQMADTERAVFVFFNEFSSKLDRSFLVDRFFFWGKIGIDAVSSAAPEFLDRCHVVGHPRLDKLTLAPKISRNAGEIKVGLITRFSLLNNFALNKIPEYLAKEEMPLEQVRHGEFIGGVRPSIEDDLYAEAIEIKSMMNLLENLSCMEGVSVELRIHPREDQYFWESFLARVFKNKDTYRLVDGLTPFNHWMINLDYLIGPPSTSFYEALALGVTPISIHKLSPKRASLDLYMCEDSNQLMPHIFSPTSYQELLSFILDKKRTSKNAKISSILRNEAGFDKSCSSLEAVRTYISLDLETSPKAFTLNAKIMFIWFFIRVFFLNIWLIGSKLLLRQRSQSSNFILTARIANKIDRLSGNL